jgi:hypothetical protein
MLNTTTANRTLTLTVTVKFADNLTSTVEGLLGLLNARLAREDADDVYDTFYGDHVVDTGVEIMKAQCNQAYEVVDAVRHALYNVWTVLPDAVDCDVEIDGHDGDDVDGVLMDAVREAHPFPKVSL